MAIKYLSGITVDSTVLVVDSANDRVGIGTASPTEKLHVVGDVRFTANTYVGGIINAYQGDASIWVPNVGQAFTIKQNTGSVGIGTTSPNGNLHVASSPQTRVLIENTGNDANGAGLIMTVRSSGTIVGNGGIYVDNSNNLILYNGGVYAGNERVRINNSGYVGVNTTAPSSFLTVSPGGSGNAATFTSGANLSTNYVGITLNSVTTSGVEWYGSEIRNINTGGTPGYLNPRLGFFTQNASTYLPADRTEKMSILGNGNVGIGTTSPSALLTIDSGEPRFRMNRGGTQEIIINHDGTTGVFRTESNTPLAIGTNGSEKVRITSAGNVGIGTTSPARKLDIVSTNAQIRISDGTANTYWEIMSLFFQSNQDFIIQNQNNVGILINSSGNVGLGTATPGAKIHVVGTESRFGGVASGFISVYNATGRSGYIQANGGTDLRIASDSDPMTMYVNGSERMRISSAGALKLNAYGSGSNTGTATQRLAVDASGNVIEIPIGSGPVDGNGTANYVTKWSDTDTITNSIIYDNGTNVGIGTATPSSKLDVAGSTNVSTTNFYRYDGDTGIFGSGTSISGGTANQLGIRAANEILFATNGATEKMRLTTGGQLIVGGTTVGYAGTKLQVGNTSDVQNGLNILTSTTGYGYILFGDGAGADTYVGQIWYYHGDNYMGFQTNGGERMRINSAGNIGIGTTSPAYRLDVQAAAGVAVRVRNTFNTDDAYFLAQSTLGSALFGINATGQYLYTGDAIPTLFYNSGTERMRITSAGNVGIGTTSPASALQIGSVGSTGYSVGNGLAFGDGTRAGALNVDSNGTTLYSSTNLIFSPGTTEAVRITSSGNVGIGTTSPSYKLDVRGNLLAVGPNGGPGIIGIWEAENIASTGGSIVSDSSASGGSAWTTNGNYQLFGPYTNLPRGNYRLSVRVKVADASYTGNAVRINVYIPSVGSAQDRYIKGIDFSANDTWEMFSIPFKITGITANNVEFYVFGLNSQSISVDYLSVTVDNDSYTAQNWGNLYVNGNVGIGTTSPAAKLHTVGSGIVNIVQSSDTVSYTQYYNTSTGNGSTSDGLTVGLNGIDAYVFSREAGNLILGTLDTERVRITSAGNVGIGTTSPSSLLHIVGSSPTLKVEGTSTNSAKVDLVGSFTTWSLENQYVNGATNDMFRLYNSQLSQNAITVDRNSNYVGLGTTSPAQRLDVNGNVRVTGAYYDSNNEAGTSGQVLSSTGSGTDWVTPATTTASSLYDLLPAARTTYDWTVQMTSGTWADIFSSNTVLSNGTWMVQVYVDDYASGGQQYQETYSGVMSWGNAASTNQGGVSAISEVVLHRSGHAANAGQFYLRTQERTTSTLLLQGMINYSHTSNTTINFKFVKVF